jgi:glycosyltransferase involved in cell wall biosynthesis
MRILQLAPLWESVPPPAYGGTEAVVSLLTDELVRLGHEVTLAASGDSATNARLLTVYPRSLRRADDLADRHPYEWVHVASALARAGDYDVVHNHSGELAMSMTEMVQTPVLTTTHCLSTPDTAFIWRRYRHAYNTLSRRQQSHFTPIALHAANAGHVHNAVAVDTFPFEPVKGQDLLFLSRVAPEKGPQHAVEVAKRSGRRLIIAGKVDQYDRLFFEEVMRDLIDGEQIVFFGEADAAQKRELYARARCLLFPITWEEPFGLVMPEAMACGTPVVAFNRGSAPEVIDHGRTGFVVDTIEEMVDAVARVGAIEPSACRLHVRLNFSPEAMARRYLAIYEALSIGATRRQTPVRPVVPAVAGPAQPTVLEAAS